MRPVEIVVGYEAGVLATAAARETDSVDRRMGGPRETLERTKRRERDPRRAPEVARDVGALAEDLPCSSPATTARRST